MIKVVNERHDREWAQYLKDSNEARKELAEAERSIKGAFNTDGQLSEGMQKEIDHMRNAHLEEWGINGRHAMKIINQQHQEKQEEISQFLQRANEGETFTNEEMEEMYDLYLASEQRDSEQGTQLQILEHIHNKQRQEAFQIMEQEITAVAAVYEKAGEAMPVTTQRRFEKRIAAHMQQWHSQKPQTPLEEFSTLGNTDISTPAAQLQQRQELAKAHSIVAAHYGGAKHIPEASSKQMMREVADFQKEIDQHNALLKNQPAEDFKERLQTIRQQQQSNKPKLH
ncbi:hypothetical protein [Taibaiella koreensis]|uniref:hypothetical protein n=1 Tax=Taibaiella koreensis TaxID=1268548 RepID=UPI000E59A748|nr:hypothetical protein [Taibaiella koreensis]